MPDTLGSENGDIRIQATKFGGNGLIYALNGTFTINVSEFNYTGSILAKRIVIQAGYYNRINAVIKTLQPEIEDMSDNEEL